MNLLAAKQVLSGMEKGNLNMKATVQISATMLPTVKIERFFLVCYRNVSSFKSNHCLSVWKDTLYAP